MNQFTLVVALAAAYSSPAFAGSGTVRAHHAYNAYPIPSWVLPLPHSEHRQMRLADGTVAIPPILIGTHASRIREIGALALAAATIK